MAEPRLVIFDCDGTLVDSQHRIVDAMEAAFDAVHLPRPSRAQIRSIIGLSLQDALFELQPEAEPDTRETMAEAFRKTYQASHNFSHEMAEPLYPGVRDAITALADNGYLMAVATGNSKRGLDRILASHGLDDAFVSLQTADFHPSKPHPSMVQVAMSDAGARADHAVIIGDTTFDMQMGRSAGINCLGISWGYHDSDDLLTAGAHQIIDNMDTLPADVKRLLP